MKVRHCPVIKRRRVGIRLRRVHFRNGIARWVENPEQILR